MNGWINTLIEIMPTHFELKSYRGAKADKSLKKITSLKFFLLFMFFVTAKRVLLSDIKENLLRYLELSPGKKLNHSLGKK